MTGRRPHMQPREQHGWRVTASRIGYENPWLKVREDDVVRPDGTPGLYGVVEMRAPAVFVVALTDADEVLMVTQYRYAPQVMSLEVPSGGAGNDDPLTAAQRELAEETGYCAGDWQQIGRMDALNGIADAPEHVFLARDLHPLDAADDRAATVQEQRLEGITAVHTVPWAQALRMVRDGAVVDGETVAALMFAALHLGRLG